MRTGLYEVNMNGTHIHKTDSGLHSSGQMAPQMYPAALGKSQSQCNYNVSFLIQQNLCSITNKVRESQQSSLFIWQVHIFLDLLLGDLDLCWGLVAAHSGCALSFLLTVRFHFQLLQSEEDNKAARVTASFLKYTTKNQILWELGVNMKVQGPKKTAMHRKIRREKSEVSGGFKQNTHSWLRFNSSGFCLTFSCVVCSWNAS